MEGQKQKRNNSQSIAKFLWPRRISILWCPMLHPDNRASYLLIVQSLL